MIAGSHQRRKPANERRRYYGLHPWKSVKRDGQCALAAYVETSGQWETVAVLRHTSGARPEELASFLLTLVNDNQQNGDVLQAAQRVLELLVLEGLNFTTEQEADEVIERLKLLAP